MKKWFMSIGLLTVFLGISDLSSQNLTYLSKVEDIQLPGGPSRFDYQSLDPLTGRLFISHMGDGKLVVFDIHRGQVLANLPGFPNATGVWLCPP
jgi:hypothetical protein